MREFSRTDRVAEQIQQELAVLIQREVKDPRLGMVTVSNASVSRDMAYAEVYVTVLGQDDPVVIRENMQILKHAAGFLRSQLARRMSLRHVPELRFHYDESIARGQQLSSLINEAVASDRDRHRDDDDVQEESP
ncbi:30S ribosome-binding factor RbfA [Larsenimonas rhizosphaerae]|uniref:Ribosome-binding factor A n=1 Tax=Larsenimonas rhizosphaerae TaxID=2944682 RepID=A0AA41ZNE6_9GAMM|nr:30S ribosome-binding factor RbfA [Larsenimonas rhizosphaerae]MCM2131570.1 30S ribosome-binding factor RbfA [Larsenimonas rhizosphaerae]MCX2525103.1 30S ribosome-binding factor RbfA [Larsenimonas rhizosphaerae]